MRDSGTKKKKTRMSERERNNLKLDKKKIEGE